MNRRARLVIASVALPLLTIGAAPMDISRCDDGERQRIAVPNDRVVLVEPKTGPAILIWISTSKFAEATYRWLVTSHQETNFSGGGRLFEDYNERIIELPDDQIRRKNSLDILAGNISLEWSGKDRWSSWIYYCPSLATARLVDSTR